MSAERIFVLSPASVSGKRAGYLMRAGAEFELAKRVQSPDGAAIGEVFTFCSGLYFRGKLAYARRFGRGGDVDGAWVITTDRGLVPPETRVSVANLRAMGGVDLQAADERYLGPLRKSVAQLAARIGPACEVVLLGSVATGKYVEPLVAGLGPGRVWFPSAFVGRGDMSRGGLMLRCVAEERELEYVAVEGAARRGPRPAKLRPQRKGPISEAAP